jgi:multiple sugar transport system permease protein/sn-glycerol 3-phosphate transport system permease protein
MTESRAAGRALPGPAAARRTARSPARPFGRPTSWLVHGLLIGAVVVVGFPFVWLLSASLKSPADIRLFPPSWFAWPMHPENYRQVWEVMPFGRYLLNSTIAAFGAVALQAVTVPTAAYAFARLRFPFRDTLFVAFLGAMMVPIHVTLIPNFITLGALGWLDTYLALWVPFGASAFGTFLVRQAFLAVPAELIDAAKLDGASHLQLLLRIMLPLARTTVLAFLLLSFTWRWNEYLWPLVMTSSREMRTLPLGLAMLRATEGYAQWQLVMAGAALSLLPPLALFLAFQRQIMGGIARTGING